MRAAIIIAATFFGVLGPAEAASDRQLAYETLEKIVAAVHGNGGEAVKDIVEHPEKYSEKDGEIYPVIFNRETGILLQGSFKGVDIRTLRSEKEAWGEMVFEAGIRATGDEPAIVSYHAPKPKKFGVQGLFLKTSFLRRVGDLVFLVGYYPQ